MYKYLPWKRLYSPIEIKYHILRFKDKTVIVADNQLFQLKSCRKVLVVDFAEYIIGGVNREESGVNEYQNNETNRNILEKKAHNSEVVAGLCLTRDGLTRADSV